MRRSKEMRSPKAAHRSPNVGSEPIAIDTGEVGKARTDPFQSLILQQMHLMQQTQAEMFQKVFETQAHVQNNLTQLHQKVHDLEKQNSVSSGGMQIGDQPASRDINTMSAKNKSSSSGNQFSLNGLQALVK